jgi:hypothetical protein
MKITKEMKLMSVILLISMMFLVLTVAAAELQNGNFETYPDTAWTYLSADQNSTNPISGLYSAWVNGDSIRQLDIDPFTTVNFDYRCDDGSDLIQVYGTSSEAENQTYIDCVDTEVHAGEFTFPYPQTGLSLANVFNGATFDNVVLTYAVSPTPTPTPTPTQTESPYCNIYAHPSEYSILWDYSSCSNVINATIDSYTIFGFEPVSGTYVLRDLQPNQTHKFMVYNEPYGYFSSTATTLNLPIPVETSQDKIWDFVFEYLLVIIVICLIVIGVNIPLVALIGLVFSVIGLIDTLVKGNFMLDIIFFITLLAALFVAMEGEKK